MSNVKTLNDSGYRADIDGLRAIAVLSVVLYHLGLNILPGGYVGVDIFFVISGYLITGIINREISNHKFSYMKFYERRIRRIFPALFFMLLISAIASPLLLLPSDMKTFGASLIATILSASNIFFWRVTDYFNPSAELNPLLHTWSLGVEEQFYIIFPAVLFLTKAISSKKRNILLITAAFFLF